MRLKQKIYEGYSEGMKKPPVSGAGVAAFGRLLTSAGVPDQGRIRTSVARMVVEPWLAEVLGAEVGKADGNITDLRFPASGHNYSLQSTGNGKAHGAGDHDLLGGTRVVVFGDFRDPGEKKIKAGCICLSEMMRREGLDHLIPSVLDELRG